MCGVRLGELQGEAMTPELAAAIALLDPADREAFYERAAIIEFDGEAARADAEMLAFREVTGAILRRRVAKLGC